jgi:hypothetical protein
MQRETAGQCATSIPSTDILRFLKAQLAEAALRLIITEATGLSSEQQSGYELEELGEKLSKVPILMPTQLKDPEAFRFQYQAVKPTTKSVWQSVVRELNLLVTTHGLDYARLRKKLQAAATNDTGLVTMIAASMGSRIGVPATVLVPAIACALLILIADSEPATQSRTDRSRAAQKT